MRWSLVLCTVLLSCLTPGWAQDVNTTTTPSGDAGAQNANLRNLLTLVQMNPELRQLVMNQLNLDASQLQRLFDFAQSIVESGTNSSPGSLEDLLAAFMTSGLFSNTDAINSTAMPQNNTGPPMAPYTLSWPKCAADLTALFNGLRNSEMWALTMLDASGKPGSGILKGNLMFLGNYLQCNDVQYRNAETFTSVDGKICRAMITPPFDVPGAQFLATPWGVKIGWDLCLPSACQESDLNRQLAAFNLLQSVFIYCAADLDMSNDNGAIISIVVLSILGAILVLGTLLDVSVRLNERQPQQPAVNNVYVNTAATIDRDVDGKVPQVDVNGTKENDGTVTNLTENGIHVNNHQTVNGTVPVPTNENIVSKPKDPTVTLPTWQRALLAFSIPRNTEKILGVKAAPGSIGCLHGIRVMSMGWVILGHTILLRNVFENPLAIYERIRTVAFQIIINATLSVDTFFVMSGLLTCYMFLKQYGNQKIFAQKSHIVLYYVHRYWRLTPPLLAWIMMVANLLRYVGEGKPVWVDYGAAQVCRDNWWVNLLYINNVYKDDERCVGVSWFLAHDMQFYVVAPLALIPWAYGKKIGKFFGFLMAFVFIGIHMAATLWIEVDINADILRKTNDYNEQIYFKPYTRVAPFAIGLIMGWILWKTKCKIRMNKYVVAVGWMVCLSLVLILTLVTYDQNKYDDLVRFAEGWPKAGRVVYETLRRPLWALAISWIILACTTGYGGPINSILSWEGWLPMSRLTYCAFLVHITIIVFEGSAPESTILFTSTTVTYQFLSNTVMSYLVAFILAVCVEAPSLGLEKVLLK